MRVRTDYDLYGMRGIGGIVAEVLDRLCLAAVPGMTTGRLDELAGLFLDEFGASPTPLKEYGFPGRVCVSVNDEVVHGVPGSRVLREGDLLKLDLTADKLGFVADATRMVALAPADDLSLRLAESAKKACLAAVAAAREGVTLNSLGGVIEKSVARDGFRVIRELCGHGIGRRVHEEPEVPNYPDGCNPSVLRGGMVITIEPIISAGTVSLLRLADGWTLATADRARSAHYEETVVVGGEGCEIVTANRAAGVLS